MLGDGLRLRFGFYGALVLAAITSGCGAGEQHLAERSLTSTVTLGRESLIDINLPISVAIDGRSRGDDVVISVDLIVTASTASAARDRAAAMEILTTSAEGILSIGITEPKYTGLAGMVTVTMPGDLDVRVTERGGTVDVVDLDGQLLVNSLAHVRVTGAKDNLGVGIEAGNALIQTEAQPGKQTVIRLKRGDIELTLPPAVSADIVADVLGNGNIVVAHPSLPKYPGGTLPYQTSVAGGLSVIRLETGSGLIVIK
jgi:hypothetical protein